MRRAAESGVAKGVMTGTRQAVETVFCPGGRGICRCDWPQALLSKVVDLKRFTRMIFSVDFLEVIDRYFGVDHGRFKGFMAKKFLDMTDGCTVFQHMRCTGVSEGVGCNILLYS